MRRYDDEILGRLLDRFERSALSRGENQRNISIAYKINKNELPEYFDESRMDFETIHSQLLALEEAGLVRLVWKRGREGQILEKCLLVPEKVRDAYRRLGKKSRDEKERRLLETVGQYESTLPAFAKWVRERIGAGKSVRQYLDMDAPAEAERICRLAVKIQENRSRVFLREFSIAVFHDSKVAEREVATAARILADFSNEELQGLETWEILEEFLVFRNPSWIFLKGGPFSHTFPGGFGFTEEDAARVRWDPEEGIEEVLTIENLTTFHQWKAGRKRRLVVYLGGYANRAKRDFLRRIREAYPAAGFLHYGDIDCGGFRIWKTLVEGTGIPIRPFSMDLSTYRRHLAFGRELTEHDRKTLGEMQKDPFFEAQRELFSEMLREGVKLEQEVIGYEEGN